MAPPSKSRGASSIRAYQQYRQCGYQRLADPPPHKFVVHQQILGTWNSYSMTDLDVLARSKAIGDIGSSCLVAYPKLAWR